jgi:Mn-dependent DtxR family transcriptional regulator
VLGVDALTAEVDACKTEHLLSAETTQRMADFASKYIRDRKTKK